MASNAIITKSARTKLVRARAGDITLPAIMGMAFGDGGADPQGNPIPPTEGQASLRHELLRKTISSHEFTEETTCRYVGRIAENELAGEDISEIGLYDTDGDLVCIKTFTPKGKDADLEMTFTLDDAF